VRSEVPLAAASKRALDVAQLRDQLGRLGETPFALARWTPAGLAPGLFLPVSELNRLRQAAVDELTLAARLGARGGSRRARRAHRGGGRRRAGRRREPTRRTATAWERHAGSTGWPTGARVRAEVRSGAAFDAPAFVVVGGDGDACAGGACDVPAAAAPRSRSAPPSTTSTTRARPRRPAPPRSCSIRSSVIPAPPLARVRALADDLAGRGVALRLRTPTIVRPAERRALEKWLALELPLLSGHLGIVAEFGRTGAT
jgi:putative protease